MNGLAKRVVLVAALVLVAGEAMATPGGVDSEGCHNPKHGGRHCHALKPVQALPAHESAQARNKRMKRECKNQANQGPCLGYGRK